MQRAQRIHGCRRHVNLTAVEREETLAGRAIAGNHLEFRARDLVEDDWRLPRHRLRTRGTGRHLALARVVEAPDTGLLAGDADRSKAREAPDPQEFARVELGFPVEQPLVHDVDVADGDDG